MRWGAGFGSFQAILPNAGELIAGASGKGSRRGKPGVAGWSKGIRPAGGQSGKSGTGTGGSAVRDGLAGLEEGRRCRRSQGEFARHRSPAPPGHSLTTAPICKTRAHHKHSQPLFPHSQPTDLPTNRFRTSATIVHHNGTRKNFLLSKRSKLFARCATLAPVLLAALRGGLECQRLPNLA